MAVTEGLLHLTASKVSIHHQSHLTVSIHDQPGLWLQVYRTSWQVHVAERNWEQGRERKGLESHLKT